MPPAMSARPPRWFYNLVKLSLSPLAEADYKGDTVWSDIDHQQRWVLPSDFDLALPLSHQDQIRMITDPRSSYAEAVRAAWARRQDAIVVAAALGNAKTGPYDNMVNVAFSASQIIPGSGKGLTIEKLILAREMVDAAEIAPGEERYMAVTSKQISNLLGDTKVTSVDYANIKALVYGEVDTFMGFKFKRLESLPKVAAVRQCFAWVKSGLHFATWDSLSINVTLRADKRNTWQLYARGTMGATRTQEKKVVQIDCQE